MKATLEITVEFEGGRLHRARLIELAREQYADHPASDMTDAVNSDDPGRPIPPEEQITDLEDAIMQFVEDALMDHLPSEVTYSGTTGPGPLDDEGRRSLAEHLKQRAAAGHESQPEAERRYGSLARNLAAAFIAHRLRISVAHARKSHVTDSEPVGLYWIQLAAEIERRMLERVDAILPAAEPTGGRPN